MDQMTSRPFIIPVRLTELNPKRRATRAPHYKTKTGCGTCKTRHVKCDEAKPHCNRCARSGYLCDGYEKVWKISLPKLKPDPKKEGNPIELNDSSENHIVLLPRHDHSKIQRAFTLVEGTEQEKACFDWFRTCAAARLAAPFEKRLWTHDLLQLSHVEPTVWHGLLATSSVLKHYALDSNSKNLVSIANRQFAIKHYTKAVGLLRLRITQSDVPLAVVLMSCFLFFTLENYLGNTSVAFAHLEGALSIIGPHQVRPGKQSTTTKTIIAIILWNWFHWPWLYGPQFRTNFEERFGIAAYDLAPKKFSTLLEAHIALFQLHIAGELPHSWKFESSEQCDSAESFKEFRACRKHKCEMMLKEWSDSFEELLVTTPNPTEMQVEEIATLKGRVWFSTLLVAAAFSPEEIQHHVNIKAYEASLVMAEAEYYSINCGSKGGSENTFFFLIHHFALLYTFATKCWNFEVRKRASKLLKLVAHKGMWDSVLMSKVAERVIELEEEGLADGDRDESGMVIPALWARVYEFAVLKDTEGDNGWRVVRFWRGSREDNRFIEERFAV